MLALNQPSSVDMENACWTEAILLTFRIELAKHITPYIPRVVGFAEGRMRQPGIVIKFVDLEYILPSLFPGAALIIE